MFVIDGVERGRDLEAADWETVARVHGDLPYMVRLAVPLPSASDTDAMLMALWVRHADHGDGLCAASPDALARLPAAAAVIGGRGCVPHGVVLTQRDLRVCAAYGVEGAEGVGCVLLAAGMAAGASKGKGRRGGGARCRHLH